jgi:predicted RNA-binding Zn-ribbon protein involved in translation (DUF1610 family)
MDIACPQCGETDDLRGSRGDTGIDMTCESCGFEWPRSLAPKCPTCGSTDMQTVPLAIVEKSRGTQLSVLGTRPIDLCSTCDAEKLVRYHRNRPNPLMPDVLPTVGKVAEPN